MAREAVPVVPQVPGGPGRRATRRWLPAVVLVVLLVAMVLQLTGRQEEFASVRRLSPVVLAAASVLQLIAQLFLNGSMLLPLRRCVTKVGFWELYLVRTGGLFAGSLVPVAGGLAVRLAYLKRRGLTYLDFTWATLVSNLLALAAAAVLGVVAAGVLWARAGRPPAAVLVICAALLAVSVAALVAFEHLPQFARLPVLGRWRWLAQMRRLEATGPLAVRVFGLSMARHLFNFITFGLLYRTLSGQPDDFLTGGLVSALTSPIRMVNVTPANLGVNEWFVALIGRMVAFDIGTGLIVALAFRGVGVVSQLAGAAFGSAWLAVKKTAVAP